MRFTISFCGTCESNVSIIIAVYKCNATTEKLRDTVSDQFLQKVPVGFTSDEYCNFSIRYKLFVSERGFVSQYGSCKRFFILSRHYLSSNGSSVETEKVLETIKLYCYVCRVWLAKCWKIQQLACLYSTTYIYVQQNIFLFHSLQLYSTFCIYVQQYAFSFHIQLNYFHSTTIFIQLQ